MSHQLPDASKMQEELLRTFSESAVRVARVWSKALEGAGLQLGSEGERRTATVRPDPGGFPAQGLSGASPARFQEMVEKAARDLPDLIMSERDHKTVRRIRDKWLKEYEVFYREFFGIPAPSETRKVLSEWKALLERGSGWGYPQGLIPGFPSSPFTLPWFPAGRLGAGPDLFHAWEKAYEKTLEKMFPLPARPDSLKHLDKSYKEALDAQIAFLDSLIQFHEQVVKTASAAVDRIVDEVGRLGMKEVSDDTYRAFYRAWLAQNEKAFQDLTESDIFSKSLAETAQWGTEAKNRLEALMNEGFAVLKTSNRTAVEELSRAVEVMTARIDRLEEEVRDLRRQVSALSVGAANEEE